MIKKAYRCPICFLIYDTINAAIHCCEPEQIWVCDECGNEYEGKKKPIICDWCKE